MTVITRLDVRVNALHVLQRNVAHAIGNVFGKVADFLEAVEQIGPNHNLDRIFGMLEQLANGLEIQLIALFLEESLTSSRKEWSFLDFLKLRKSSMAR